MPAAMLDTLRCAQNLKEAGFTQQQADGTARVLGDALAGVATKEDLDEAIAGPRTEVHHGFAAQKAQMDTHFPTERAGVAAGFAAQRAETARAFAEYKTQFTQLHAKLDAIGLKLKLAQALLGLLCAMSAYDLLQPGPVAALAPAPAHIEAPQAPTPSEDQASQAGPAEPSRTLPIKPPKDTAPG